MKRKILTNPRIGRLEFYWLSSFVLATLGYCFLWVLMPSHYVFGIFYRMIGYHYAHPIQYIAIPCFFYGIFANLLSDRFSQQTRKGSFLLTVAIIFLTILFSSPFGGMLWHIHDMLAGRFPDNWMEIMLKEGFSMGMEIGWFIILISIPYNIFGTIICFFLTWKGIELFPRKNENDGSLNNLK